GNKTSNAVYAPELFDPVSETWTDLPSASVPRTYHQTAILTMDGRVWNAGTTPDKMTKILDVEIFNPWYISETRPTISGDPTGGAYGSTITIPTPDAADITKVSLIRQSSCTHHYNTDQRLIWLQIESKAASSVTVKAPINNKLAPPGMYLIHVLNGSGVPSAGKFITIPGEAAPPPPPSGEFVSIYSVTPTNSYLKMYTGSLKRAGEWITTSSVLKGESIKRVSVILKKSGSPTGTISVVVRKGTGDSIALTFGTIDASTLTDTDQTFTLTAPSSYTFAANDKVLVEWDGTGSGTEQVWLKRRFSSDPATGFDGSATKQAAYVSSYTSHGGSDIGGEWFKET
ncbi:MAG: galactose oxidase-like domain-containing protein, partial [Nitrososphaera sp.]